MLLLWVKAGKLLPVDTGGKLRSYNILRHLSLNHDVRLLSYYPGTKDASYEAALKNEFPKADTLATGGSDGNLVFRTTEYLARSFQRTPFAVSKFTHPAVKSRIRRLMQEEQFDVCICDFLAASRNFPDYSPTTTLLFAHNVETILWKRRAATESNAIKRFAYKFEAARMAGCERKALRRFPHVIAVSDRDRDEFVKMEPTCKVSVVPTGVDTRLYAAAPPSKSEPPAITFVGSMDWEPNIDAVLYFCREIFPRVRAALPSAIFQIVGRMPPERVKRLAGNGVQVTGTVPSVTGYLLDATIVVVPLRSGGGTRLKIFEAMAMGKAVVSTTIGAEGLDIQHGRDLILADDPADFAEAIVLLAKNEQIRRTYEKAALDVASKHDWSIIAQRFAEVLYEARAKATLRRGQEPQSIADTAKQKELLDRL